MISIVLSSSVFLELELLLIGQDVQVSCRNITLINQLEYVGSLHPALVVSMLHYSYLITPQVIVPLLLPLLPLHRSLSVLIFPE